MKVIRHAGEEQKVYSEIGCKLLEFFFEPAFSVIKFLPERLSTLMR